MKKIILLIGIVMLLLISGCNVIIDKGNITSSGISNDTKYIMYCIGLNGTEHPIMTDKNGNMKWWECKDLCNYNPEICKIMIDRENKP